MPTTATAELEQALRHEQALRRLAARLCKSPDDADDAVQHALSQVALGRRPSEVPLLAFLRTALRNCAFNLHKLARRRRQREARAAAPATAGRPVDELVAREQLRRRVAAAVLALDEPYRTTVWLRWFEDLPVAVVAVETRVPVNTVRTRLQRAHARLRARLDRDYGDRQWTLLAAPIQVVASVGGGGAAASAAALAGAIVVKKTLFVVAAVAVLAGSWWWLPSSPDGPVAREAASGRVPEVASAPREAPEAVREPVASEPQAVPVPEPAVVSAPARDPSEEELAPFAADVEPGCIEGIVLRGLVPVGGGRAWARGMENGGLPWGSPREWDAADGVLRAAIDGRGLFRFEGLAADQYMVGIEAPDGASRHVFLQLRDGQGSRRIRIVLGSAVVRGRVFDPDGAQAPSWHVAIYNWGRMVAGTQVIAGTVADARGEFEFAGLCGGSYLLQASPVSRFNDERAQGLRLDLAAGEERIVQLGSPAMASQWRGRVLLPRGSPLPLSMLVELELADDGVASRHRLDEHGAFDVRVAAGTYRATLFLATGPRVSFGEMEVPAGASVRDLVVPNAVRVRPTFVAGTAQPKWPEGALRARMRAPSGFVSQSVRGRDGFEYFVGLDAGDYELQCWPHPIAGAPPAGIPVTVPAADELEVDVVVERR